jgi:hypothetical protein
MTRPETIPECIGCGTSLPEAIETNKIGDEFICDSCRNEMMSSLEGAWKRHSAFLDSALN